MSAYTPSVTFLLEGSKDADGLPDAVTSWSWVDDETGEGVSVELDSATQRPVLMQQGDIAMTFRYADDVLASVSFTKDGVDEGTVELNIPLEGMAAGSGRALESAPSHQITSDLQQHVGYGKRLDFCEIKEPACTFVSERVCTKLVGCGTAITTCRFLISSGCAPCAIFGCLGVMIFGCVDTGFLEDCKEQVSEVCDTEAGEACDDDGQDDDAGDDDQDGDPKRGKESEGKDRLL